MRFNLTTEANTSEEPEAGKTARPGLHGGCWVTGIPTVEAPKHETGERKLISAFVSYRWEDSAHNQWVHTFCNDLRRKYGIDAKVDEFEAGPGDSFVDYMTRGIHNSDYMLFVVTPSAVKAVEESRGSLYFELQLGLARQIAGEPFKIIPIFREGTRIPDALRSQRYVDFRDDNRYEETLSHLAKWMTRSRSTPKGRPPAVAEHRWLRVKGELYYASAIVGGGAFGAGTFPDKTAQELTQLKYVRIDSGSYRVEANNVTFFAYYVRDAAGGDPTLADVRVKVGKYGHGGTGMRITKDITASFDDHENGAAQQLNPADAE